MNFLFLSCLTFLPLVWTNPQNPISSTDLVDFEFDDGNGNKKISKNDRIDVNWEEDTTADNNEQNVFDARKQHIRNSLVQATKDATYVKKFAKILPIMRTLTKQQRLVLASLISAQTSARSNGNVMNLAQVSVFV